MTDLDTTEYYLRREQQERALASAAKSPAIREIHLELAERYACIALKGGAPMQRPQLKLVSA